MMSYLIEDLIKDFGESVSRATLSEVKRHYKNQGMTLSDPVAMAHVWLNNRKKKEVNTLKVKEKPMFDTQAYKSISSMLFAMGRMEHNEMKKLPGALFRGKAKVGRDSVLIDWNVPGITDEQIARVESCLGMRVIIQGRPIKEELPF